MPDPRRLTLGLIVLASIHGPPARTDLLAAQRPNIVFIMADDLTFRDIGCYGGQAHTPNIDRLAEQGLRFTRCFQAAPMCSPTRHNLYTGLYPVKSGAYPNHTFARKGTKSLAHYLKPLGYRVALSGKTHIAPREVFPFEYSGKKNPDMQRISQLFADSRTSGTPFCLFACSNEPHTPWDKGDASRYPPGQVKLPLYLADTPVVREHFSRYLAEITYFDDQVGEILSLLDHHKLSDDTLVMVVSEQGNSLPFAKWTCYGHGLQSAMVVRWPGHVKAGTETDAMVEYVDVAPTFIAAAGGQLDRVLDGRSFLPVLHGEADRHKDYSYGIMTTRGIINGSDAYGIRSIRGSRFRLIWNLHHQTTFRNACTKSLPYRSIVEAAASGDEQAQTVVEKYQHRPEFELFDCEADPLEQHNLANEPKFEEVQAELQQKLKAWMIAQGDQGVETELDALLHQGRYKGMTRDEAVALWRKKKPASGPAKPGRQKKKPKQRKNRQPAPDK